MSIIFWEFFFCTKLWTMIPVSTDNRVFAQKKKKILSEEIPWTKHHQLKFKAFQWHFLTEIKYEKRFHRKLLKSELFCNCYILYLCYRQGICSSHLTRYLTLNFIFGYCLGACSDLKTTVYIFCWYLLVTWQRRNRWKMFTHKTFQLSCQWKENLYWSIFAIEPIADFCPVLCYWPSKNVSHDFRIKDRFVSLVKPTTLCTIGKIILYWSIFAKEPIAGSCPFLGYWPSKNESRDHDVKGELVSLAKHIAFATTGKKNFFINKHCCILIPRGLKRLTSSVLSGRNRP